MTDLPEGEPREDGPVHYQVSITGRQAGFFFIALLAALGLAFFFGMKTGAGAHRAPDAATRLAAASDLPAPTAVPEPDTRAAAPASQPAERPLGFEDAAAGGAVAAKEARKAAAPRPTPEPEKTPSPAKPVAAPAGKAWVHAAALNAEKADALAKKLREKGYPTDVSPVDGKPDLFRVRIGPYADRAKADAAVRKLKSEKWSFRPEVHTARP